MIGDNMLAMNFKKYNKDAELPNGDYWKFVNESSKDLIDDNINLCDISNVIKEITNPELKLKMKNKIHSLISRYGLCFHGLNSSLDIFNSDELKVLLKDEFNFIIVSYISSNEKTQRCFAYILDFVDLLKNVNDDDWEVSMISIILNTIKNYEDKHTFISILERNIRRKEVFKRLIDKFYNDLPEPYKNLLKIRQDNNYIYNKSLRLMEEDIDIGIDPRIKIAPEIEANNDLGIKISLDNQIGFSNYVVDSEVTVPMGIEIFPRRPFHNTKEDMAKFCGLCETMKDLGYYYNDITENAAGQINLGLDYLDTKEAILNFYEIYCNCEELLYYISHEEGQLFRQDVYDNSRMKAISEIIGKYILDEELSRQDVINLFNSHLDDNVKTIHGLKYKRNSVCLRGSSEHDYRLEFRIPNGGCNYRTWIDNIRLYGKMLEISKKIANMMKKDYLSDDEQKLLKIKISLQDNSLDLEEKLVMLMDLLFEDDNIKQIYYNRYISTIKKIKETNSLKYIDCRYSYYDLEPSFDKVEFIGKYSSRLDPEYKGPGVIEYDPECGITEHHRKK